MSNYILQIDNTSVKCKYLNGRNDTNILDYSLINKNN